jgi:hypothetical protein
MMSFVTFGLKNAKYITKVNRKSLAAKTTESTSCFGTLSQPTKAKYFVYGQK